MSKKSVAFVQGSEKNCGIYYYAQTVVDILKKSENYDFYLFECDSEEEFHNRCKADVVIINYHPTTLSWFNPAVSSRIKQMQFFIDDQADRKDRMYHLLPKVKEVITMDVTKPQELHFHPGVRPVQFYDDIVYNTPKLPIRIGTSGIGRMAKNLDKMVALINSQFTEQVEFRIHLSVGKYAGFNDAQTVQLIDYCKRMLAPNIKCIFTNEKFSDRELVQWMNQNDVNIFIYDNADCDNVGSSIDKALAARKPFGVNSSNLLRHVFKDETNLEKTSIKQIIANGIAPLEEYYNKWNSKKLIDQYETLLRNNNV